MMHKFDWREVERDEYSRSEEPSFVKLTTRSYITAMGVAPDRVTDQAFTSLAAAVTQIAERISDSLDVACVSAMIGLFSSNKLNRYGGWLQILIS